MSIRIRNIEDLQDVPRLNGVYQLQGANLQDANLQGANLQGANLFSANLQGANLESAILNNASLNFANLQGAHLERAILNNASLNSAILRGAFLNGANLQDAHLFLANLQGANLQGAQLERANLTRAILRGANLTGTIHERPRRSRQPQQPPPPPPQQVIPATTTALAYQIHNFFNRINKNELNNIISELPPEWTDEINIIEYMSPKFNTFIEENYTNPEKDKLKKTFGDLMIHISHTEYVRDIDLKKMMAKSVHFAFKQEEKEFTKNYIEIFISDSSGAYANNPYGRSFSCPKGVVERIITSLGSAAEVLCKPGCADKPYEEIYTKLIEIFSTTLNKGELLQKWNEEVKPIWNSNELDTPLKRANHFREFMKREYARILGCSYIPATHDAEIEKDIETYQYVFSNTDDQEPVFGGKKNNKKYKQKTQKTKNSKKQKKNKSKKKTIKKLYNKQY